MLYDIKVTLPNGMVVEAREATPGDIRALHATPAVSQGSRFSDETHLRRFCKPLVEAKQRIDAIKLVIGLTGWSLKDSKAWVDREFDAAPTLGLHPALDVRNDERYDPDPDYGDVPF